MIALTIGTFDGVHRGHQHLLKQLKLLGGKSVVITFSNHPASVLGMQVPQQITPISLKKELLLEYVDEVIVLEFTKELAQLTYEQFLQPCPIRHLVLGEGTVLGAGRQGTVERLRVLGQKRGFDVHEVPHLLDDGKAISSSRIRALLVENNLEEAERLLGRKLYVH